MNAKAFLYIDMFKTPLSYDVTCFDVDGHDVSLKFITHDNEIFKVLKEISNNKLYVTHSLEVIYKEDKFLFTPICLMDYDVIRLLSNSVCEMIVKFKYFNEIKDNEHKI